MADTEQLQGHVSADVVLQPGEKLSKGGIIYRDKPRNIRETIKFEEDGDRPEVQSDDPGLEKVVEHIAGSIEKNETEDQERNERISELEERVRKSDEQAQKRDERIAELEQQMRELMERSGSSANLDEDPDANKKPDASGDSSALYDVDRVGRGHRPDGKFISRYEEELIKDNADLILDNLPKSSEEDLTRGALKRDKEPVPRNNGEEYQYPSVEFSPELQEDIETARNAYAYETAKKRDSYLGRFLRNSKYLAKIPFLKSIAEKLNDSFDGKLDDAREEYHRVMNEALAEVQRQHEAVASEEVRKTKEYEDDLRVAKTFLITKSQPDLEAQIYFERQKVSGKSNKFVEWWVSREGVKGKIAKALVVGGTGVALGLGAGLLAAPVIAGTALGGAAGLWMGDHVTKRRANASVDGGATVAERQRDAAIEAQRDYIGDAARDQRDISIEEMTRLVENQTASEVARNRNRVKAATGIGAAGGGVGAQLGSVIREGLSSAGESVGDPNLTDKPAPESTPPSTGTEAPAPTPELMGQNFDIQSGSGFTQEIMDFASANGQSIEPGQAFELHNELMNNFGNYIQDAAGNPIDTYTQGVDLRINAPGIGKWAPGVSEYIQNWMAARGLW